MRQSSFGFNFNHLLIILLIGASFFLGMLWTKTQYLEKQQKVLAEKAEQENQASPQVQEEKTITQNDIKAWAKELGLDTKKFNECFDSQKYKSIVDKDLEDAQKAGVTGTPAFFINGISLAGAQPFSAFKEIINKELSGESKEEKISVELGNNLLGNKSAKVKIVEFSDFQCPFCRSFWSATFPEIKKEYVDTGKASFSYRHFPLEFHELAAPFALASECAGEQGKFWEFQDKIFGEQ